MGYPGSEYHCGPGYTNDPLGGLTTLPLPPDLTPFEPQYIPLLQGVTKLAGANGDYTALSAIPTVGVITPFVVEILLYGTTQTWLLVDSTLATGPGVQRPNDYNASTNAKAWTIQLSYNLVAAEVFGAVGDGVTDDTAAIQAAVNSFGLKGGVLLMQRSRYLIDSANLTVPLGVELRGAVSTWTPFMGVTQFGNYPVDDSLASVIVLNPSYTIKLQSGAGLRELVVLRKGAVVGELTTSAFTGTAVSSVAPSYAEDLHDCYIRNVCILGFAQAINFSYSARSTFENISGDNLAGIKINYSWDVLRIKGVHFWPLLTQYSGVSAANLQRSGAAIEIAGIVDVPLVDDVFAFGYLNGIKLNGAVGAGTFTNCVADTTTPYTGSVGFNIIGVAADFSQFINCKSYNYDKGFLYNTAAGTDRVSFNECQSILSVTNGFEIANGLIAINGGMVTAGSSRGILANGATTVVTLNAVNIGAATTNTVLAATGATIAGLGTCSLPGLASNSGGWAVTSLVAADPLPLTNNNDFFIVTGNTSFSNITGQYPGRGITLKFTGTPTIFNGANIKLAGAANFVASADDMLTLRYDGASWVEANRSVN